MNATAFLQTLFGDDAPGSLVLFALPGEIALWNEAADLQGAVQQVAQFLPSHNIYFGVSLQDRRAAETEWRRRNPNMKGGPTTRGYSSTASAIPGVWADFDVQSPVHKASNLPPTKAAAQQMLAAEFPLEPSLLWDSGYGLQGFWLFRELWIFDSAEERQQAQIFVRRFIATLNQLAKAHGWRIDPTSDLARVLRLPGSWNRKQEPPLPVTIVSNKPEIRYNPSDFEPYLVDLPAPKPSIPCDSQKISHDLKKARAALPHIPSDAYDIWLKVGMALHSAEGGEDGLSVWGEWSRTCPEKFDGEALRYKWSTFTVPGEGGSSKVTLGTLFSLAKEHGWAPPAKEEPPFPDDGDAPPQEKVHLNGTRNGARQSPPVPDEDGPGTDAENARIVEQERELEPEPGEESKPATYPCPDILWQGIFAEVAKRVGLRSWEVWAGTYAALSAIAHRNLHWRYFGDLFGMAYVLVINPTGSGKGLVTDTCADLLPREYAARHGVQSGPGLLPLLTDSSLDNKNGRLVVRGRPVILICDEWSRLTQVAGIEHSTLIEDINSLFQRRRPWSQSRSNKNRSGGDIVITDPALSICGTTTAMLFNGCVTARQISGGFLNRHLVLPGRGIWMEYTGASPHTEMLGGLLDPLVSHAWGQEQELKSAYSPTAWERFLDLQRHFFKPTMEDPDTSEVMKRLHFYFHHIGLLYAWSEKSPTIEMCHLKAAVQVVSTSHQFLLSLLETQHAHIEPPPMQRYEMGLEQQIQGKVRREPGIARRKLLQDLHRHGSCKAIGDCINRLVNSRMLAAKNVGNGKILLYPATADREGEEARC